MTNTGLTYREGSLIDVEQLQNLAIIAYAQYQNALSPEHWEEFKSNLQDKQKFIDLLNIARCYVCEDGDKIIGAAYIVPAGNPTQLFKPEWSYIRMVGVNPDYREQVVAKELTKMCINFARTSNEKIIALHTSEFMDTARHIYENMGFKILMEIPPLFGKRYWLYTLNLERRYQL